MMNKSINLTEVNTVLSELKHLKFESQNNGVIVTLIDEQQFEILKGYGKTKSEALNDLHSNLI